MQMQIQAPGGRIYAAPCSLNCVDVVSGGKASDKTFNVRLCPLTPNLLHSMKSKTITIMKYTALHILGCYFITFLDVVQLMPSG